MATTSYIARGPSVVELGISWGYAFRLSNPHLVEFLVSTGGGASRKERVMITELKYKKNNQRVVLFRGRLERFDGDLTQEIYGQYQPDARVGYYELVESNLVAEII